MTRPCNPTLRPLCFRTFALALVSLVAATGGVRAADASRLGTDLTPSGAEKGQSQETYHSAELSKTG